MFNGIIASEILISLHNCVHNNTECYFIFTEQSAALNKFNLETILSGVHYFRCHDYVELIAMVHTLPEFLQEHPQVMRSQFMNNISFRHFVDVKLLTYYII